MRNKILIPDNKINEVLVYIPVNRYNDLIETEKKLEKNTVYVYKDWGFSGTTDTIYTDDEAVLHISKKLKLAHEASKKLSKELIDVNSKIYQLEKEADKITLIPMWIRKIFKAN